jgi:hypothetical protein
VKDPEELHYQPLEPFNPQLLFLLSFPKGICCCRCLNPLTNANVLPHATTSKNKSKKVGTFFATTQPTTNSPQATIHPPQTHHQKTTSKTQNPWKFATSTTPTFKSENPASR